MARILIVETNPFFADVLACTLGAEKHDVAVADNADEAIRLGWADHPDVVIAAWWLPGDVHGGEVCRRIRAVSPATKAIIITAREELVSQARDYCRCLAAVLVKPFHRDDILRVVRRILCREVVPPPIRLPAAISLDVAASTFPISR
jgi:DNA-binding response OmpR family regulator